MTTTSEHVFRHLAALWGGPSRTAEFSRGDKRVRVLKWSEQQTGEDVAIYATVGISDQPLGPSNEAHRAELFLGFRPEEDRIAQPLASLAFSSSPENPYFLHGHTVTFQEPLWDGTEMSAVLLMYPREAVIADLRVHDQHVRFVQVIPLFMSELEFKKATSAEALVEYWAQRKQPFWNPRRSASAPSTGAA